MSFKSTSPVTLIGGGAMSDSVLGRAMELAPCPVAADGGADTALAHGIEPEIVIGDFDSISDKARQHIPAERQVRIAEQDSTDFEKCLRAIDAPYILGVGFSGSRFDHHLATCNVLTRYPQRRCILIGDTDLYFLTPKYIHLALPKDTRISLFPMAPVTGRSCGLEWSIDGLELSPTGQIATSNLSLGPVTLWTDEPHLITILPTRYLDIALEALTSSQSWADPCRSQSVLATSRE